MTEEDQLVKSMEHYIDITTTSFSKTSGIPKEDLESTAYFSLAKCIEFWKEGKVSHFHAYAEKTVVNELINQVRTHNTKHNRLNKESVPLHYNDDVIEDYSSIEAVEFNMWLKYVIERFSDMEREFIRLRWTDRRTLVDISRIMFLSRHKSTSWRWQKRIMIKIKKFIEEEREELSGI